MIEDKLQVANRMQKDMIELAKNWNEGDTTSFQVQCTGIERAIPPGSKHESAIKALEYCALARKFESGEKGSLFLMEAEAALKDFELYDDAIKADGLSNVVKKLRKESRSR